MTETAAPISEAPAATPVRGVDLEFVSLTALNKALAEAGIKVTAKTKVEERVILLADHDAAEIGDDKDKGGACDKCGGVSLLERECCPYCGTGEEQPTADAPVAKPAPRSRKEAKAAKPSKAAKKAKEKPVKLALARTSDTAITPAHIKELDQSVRRLKGLIGDTGNMGWKLGRELNIVYNSKIYKYRLDAGVPVHSSFKDFCEAELRLSSQTVRTLMSVAENYTEKQAREIGVSKLKIISRAPKEERDRLLEKAAGGLGKRAIEAEVQAIAPGAQRDPLEHDRPGSGKRGAHLRALNAKQNVAKPTRAVAPNEATAVIVPERFELPMWARAMSTETGQPVRAKSVAADPYCIFDMQNGMQLMIKLVEDDDGLIVVGEFKRAAE